MPNFRSILTVILLAALALPGLAQGQTDFAPETILSGMPVQSGGRLKPLDTLARESVRLVTGKVEFEKRDPVLTLLGWWAKPEETPKLQVIEFRDIAVKKELGLDPERRWYSLEELEGNTKIGVAREEIHKRLRGEEQLDPDQQKIQELLGKMATVQAAIDGTLFTVVPNPSGLQEAWGSFSDLSHADTVPMVAGAKQAVTELRVALASGDPAKLGPSAVAARQELAKLGPVPDGDENGPEGFLGAKPGHGALPALLEHRPGIGTLQDGLRVLDEVSARH